MNRAHHANRLVDALPRASRKRLLASCDEIELGFGDLLWARGDRIRHVYFPEDGFVSKLVPVNGRASLDGGLVGNEGMLGVAVVLGIDTSPLDASVQGAGRSLRIGVPRFRRELNASPALRRMTHRYIYVLMAQLSQAATCPRFHLLDTRLARWLLMTHDRTSSSELHLTHELLARMLGVRRVGVTKAAGLLQQRKLISYNRGEITIIDRAGLEAASCGCYRTETDIYERTFSKEA